MHAFMLQDWTTIRGSVSTVIQGEDNWLDLTEYQDVVLWIDCREATANNVTITFQTSPTKDEILFQTLATASTLVGQATPVVVNATLTKAVTPVARYLRWVIAGSGSPWDATFRVLVAANSPGM